MWGHQVKSESSNSFYCLSVCSLPRSFTYNLSPLKNWAMVLVVQCFSKKRCEDYCIVQRGQSVMVVCFGLYFCSAQTHFNGVLSPLSKLSCLSLPTLSLQIRLQTRVCCQMGAVLGWLKSNTQLLAVTVSEGEHLSLCLVGSPVIYHPVYSEGTREMALCGSVGMVEHILWVCGFSG